ncbi:glycoside hydrolase family 127 protein [Jiangella ureilytica]|uniref:Glycoside hydrolase family 127 protein n=1 Tax=Jiangella ureilytica TaxID=2530374 RepID=A0A4R4RPH8_9ACTN|nr:beta-L-arabinofuranosidase domain-containing protein [Jiangella ureilytica]TDC50373.1 glycoside hydrolase family 127 protein [Jiangella ureilytica]
MTAEETVTGVDAAGGRPVVPARGAQRPLGLAEVGVTGGFWAELQATNAGATLEHCESWMERLGWLANFDRVASGTTGPERPGWSFSDSEVYKLVEAAAWEYGRTGAPSADAMVRRLTARIAAAQDADGYLSTCYGHGGQDARYSDLETGHELYNTGHLLQAAVARLRTTGADPLVDVARRAADHVCAEFGPDGRQGVCGHPEIEVGLAEFGRALGAGRYVEQARLFLDRRGRGILRDIPLGRAYFQDDVPVREATVFRGHAVRALYLSAGAVDVAVDLGDDDLLGAVARQWDHTVERRTYLTGGMGSRHQDEGFGEDWELPADRAYCETCAGVASVMVSWRLYLATGDVRYADLMERTFYNVVATSPRSDGRAFFYANPLHQRTAAGVGDDDTVSPRAEGGTRAAWFDVSCCPTNVARTLASWQAYAASSGPRELTLLQYAPARIATGFDDGGVLAIEVDTAYPADGTVTVRVADAPAHAVMLRLRVPPWAGGAVLSEGGRTTVVAPGFAVVDRPLVPGEQIRLVLPVAPRLTWPDRRVDAVRGCVAVERGPLVLCAESVDLPAAVTLDDLLVDPSAPPVPHDDGAMLRTAGGDDIVLIPYHRWAERGPSAMRIWLPSR